MSTAKDRKELREAKRQTRALQNIAAGASKTTPVAATGPEGTPNLARMEQALQSLSEQMAALSALVSSMAATPVHTAEVPIGGLVRRRTCPDCGNEFNKGLEEQTADTAPHEVTKHQLECDNGHIWRVTVERISPKDWVIG